MKKSSHPRNSIRRLIRKIERKIIFILLALFFIVLLPLGRDDYVTFDLIYTTTISDVFPFIRLPMFDVYPLLNILVFIVMGYIFYIIIFLFVRQNGAERLRVMYRRLDIVGFIVYLTTFYIIINAFFFSLASVEGMSMYPTLNNGDHVIMRHYDEAYERGDLVVVTVDHTGADYLIKRVIGIPGDTVTLEEGIVYINGTQLDESRYLPDDTETFCERDIRFCSFDLEDEEFFVLGDNRNDSLDSRHFGAVLEDNIYGTVNFRLRPLSDLGRIE